MAARRGKNQATRNSGSHTPGWVWLIVGVAIAAVVFLAAPGLFKKDGEFARFGPRPNPDAQPAPVADADVEGVADRAADKPATAEEPKSQTQYDFYTLLPGKEVQMTDAELAASARAEEARKARAALEGRSPLPAAQASAATATTAPAQVAGGIPAALPESAALAPARTAMPPPRSTTAPTAAAATATAAHPPAETAKAPTEVASSAKPATATATMPAPAAEADAHYILQAGAFGASGDAEMVKARIAMLGLAARVESAQAGGKTVYRVRMGPYGSASELSEAKQKLGASGLPAVAIRMQ